MSQSKVIVSIAVSWIASYTVISLGTLGKKQHIDGYLLYFRKSSFGLFTTIYVLCFVIVTSLNVLLWTMGYRSYLKDRRKIASISKQVSNKVRIERSHLKSTLIAFILTIKNIICFSPFIVVVQLRMNGCEKGACAVAHFLAGPLTASSLVSDPLISIFIMKEVRRYLKRKMFSESSRVDASPPRRQIIIRQREGEKERSRIEFELD